MYVSSLGALLNPYLLVYYSKLRYNVFKEAMDSIESFTNNYKI